MHGMVAHNEPYALRTNLFYFSGWKNVLDQPKDVHTNYDTSGTPYDYLSIMHYTQTAFAKRDRNGRLLTTIEIKDKSVS